MDNDSQLHIPASFIALFMTAGSSKPNAPREHIAGRYELCEDLANHLVGHASNIHHGQGIAEDEVLVRCHRGLLSDTSGVGQQEATWIVLRLAELLDWPGPALSGKD